MKVRVSLIKNKTEQVIEAERGTLLSDLLCLNHVHIDLPCAGRGTCNNCKVLVDGEERLVCQTRLERDVCVVVADDLTLASTMAGNLLVPPKNPMYTRYGLSIDIGTTTLYASLFDRDGQSVTTVRKNPQTAFGADVISRIEQAMGGALEDIAHAVRAALAEMTEALCEGRAIAPESIDAAVITGNTAMLYLLTGQNPVSLSVAPFLADRLFGESVAAKALALPLSPLATVYLPRSISAFVGSDITTAILASGMQSGAETALLVDIGTNGEMALWHEGTLFCCSTAAGPAFEGAGISSGMYGGSGAIDHVWHEGDELRVSTIGGGQAVGICGSGIVDALAVMLQLGIIDETGAFEEGDSFTLQNGVSVTAQDVRKIQLAKGSVRAGLETLLESAGVDKASVKTLYIAGGFGNFLNLENAVAIGLIPEELQDRVVMLGNAAHDGATILLADKTLMKRSEEQVALAKTVALDANPVFTEHYMNCMMFL